MNNKLLNRLLSEEKGQMIILFALLLTVLLGITAFTVDFGYMQWQKRELQNTADAASLAGARALIDGEDVYDEVEKYVEAHGLDENDIINKNEIQSLSTGDTEVTVELKINRVLFFAKVLGFQDTDVASLAVAEVIRSPGFPAFVSFDEDDGDIRISGNVQLDGEGQLIVHSNKDLTVDGAAAQVNPKPEGTYVGTLNDHPNFQFYGNTTQSSPITSPLENFEHDKVINSTTLETEISRLIGTGELVFKEGQEPTTGNFLYFEADDLFPHTPPGPPPDYHELSVPEEEPGVIYIDGNIDLKDKDNLTIDAGGGLIIVNGHVDLRGNSTMHTNGIVYATGYIDFGGTPGNINGGLWSEKYVWFHGNPSSFTTFDLIELPTEPSVKLTR